MPSPGLFGISGITVLRLAGRSPLAPGVLQNFLRLHAKLARFGKPFVANGFDFINLLILDFVLSFLDQSLELLDGRGFDDVFDRIAHSRAFAIINVRCKMSVIKITETLYCISFYLCNDFDGRCDLRERGEIISRSNRRSIQQADEFNL